MRVILTRLRFTDNHIPVFNFIISMADESYKEESTDLSCI